MIVPIIAFGIFSLGAAADKPAIAGHDANAIFQTVLSEGLKVGDSKVTLPPPVLADGGSADVERAALRAIAGSERAAADLTRDSVSAPFVLKTRDQMVGDQGILRIADLWFVVRARLDDIDPEKVAGSGKERQTTEAANMRFTASPLDPETLKRLGKTPTANNQPRGWYVHLSARLLDRIHVEATDRIVATRSESSWLIASRTDPAFVGDATDPNRWFPIVRQGASETPGKAQTYPGGISYTKISRLETVPGALLVESHFAFFEPKAWFDGAPILRSKIGVVAQDRIRALRRELARSRTPDAIRGGSGPKGR